MNDLLSMTSIGAQRIMQAQAINANNLANASTDGFRAELVHLMQGETEDTYISRPDFGPGAVRTTGRPLDVSVNGDGWLAVIGGDGLEAYTRRGDLHVDALGLLRNGAGQQVLGNNGPIALPPFESVEIAGDGTISIQPLGQSPNTMAVVDRLKLALPEQELLQRGEDGLMRLPEGETAPADASVRLIGGSVESSNVNAIEAMVRMIDLARQFEAQVQLMKSSQENELQMNSIMSLG